MENKKITKEDIDKIPSNLFYNAKARKQIKQFYKELRLLINEKVKKKEKLTDLKNGIFLLIKKIFPDKFQYFYVGKDFINFLQVINNKWEKIRKLYDAELNKEDKKTEPIDTEKYIIPKQEDDMMKLKEALDKFKENGKNP